MEWEWEWGPTSIALLVGLVVGYLYGCIAMIEYVEWEGWRPPEEFDTPKSQSIVVMPTEVAGSNPLGRARNARP
ncbi:hypothetical protein SAMN05444166_6305 [Singulisphaera sp. GP187]|nr:hypothetical protein SAMN05444166_6305 [Singulisphaera sp. GP187]